MYQFFPAFTRPSRPAACLACLLLTTACGAPEPAAKAPVDPTAFQPTQLVALGRIEPLQEIVSLASEEGGVIREVRVRAGDSVRRDQVLLVLSARVETARLRQSEAKFGAQTAQIAADRAALASAQVTLRNARDFYERSARASAEGAETQQNVDNAEASYRRAQRDEERLQASLRAAQAQLEQLQADARVSRAELGRRTVRAPGPGTILDLSVKPGTALSPNQSYAEFAPQGPVTALLEVDELFADRVRLGQTGLVRAEGTLDTLAIGRVVAVGPYLKAKSLFAEQTGDPEDRRVREVRLQLDGGRGLLLNRRVEGVIQLGGAAARP
ncbi:efflux RND transporter periplasmic adaptor subunit [Hymenobacter sp. BT664]|uniref:Efflux RND transporter periplasmic adaptor subunit n=1 Tax=Hymenobacter montanus TaxID=2771359 RepID=A0A927GL38_9BACT|nr:efflux RND transporter periplasmic adaptor subunit [Hymenobacter montanus]MBD2769794.1 efflux RND transporter periplasmic adaptor subunit [Hymenobacter montanus]